MSNKFGEVSWSDTTADAGSKKNSKDAFLRLNPGSNIVRLLTNPHQYYQHKYKIEGEKGFGHRIYCSGVVHGACPVCAKGDKPKRRWLLGVIDRKTNTYKILDVGFSIFKAIQTLVKDDDWGDPSKYDLDIVVDPNGGATGYYTVVAKPPKPLSATDLKLREDNDSEELVRRTTPPTPDKVDERLSKLVEEFAATESVGGIVRNGKPVVVASNDDEDGDNYEFPNHDEQKEAAPF